MITAAIYCRISRDADGREAGVARQQLDCEALARRHGFEVTKVYIENDVGASTRSRKRRVLYEEMIDAARNGAYGAIIAYSSSRLTRRPREAEDLIELAENHGVQIRTVVSGDFDLTTADGRGQARNRANWDTMEAERISERVKRQKVDAAASGRWRGGRRPFGYEADGVTVRQDEAKALETAAREILAGRSLNAIAREMNAAGLRTAGTWRHGCADETPCGRSQASQCPARYEERRSFDGTNLRRLLQRPRNAGLIEERGEVIGEAQWPAIIPEDVWRAVVATLSDPTRRTSPGSERRWLGSGLYTCGTCGAGLFVASGAGRRRSYRCPNSAHVTRDQAAVDEYVRGVISGVLSRPDAADLLREPDDGSTDALRGTQESLRARLAVFEADYAAGDINGRQLADATARVQAELDKVDAELAAKMRGTALGELADAPNPGEAFLSATLDRQRAIVDALATVTIHPGRRGRPPGWKPGETYADLDTVIVAPRG